VAKLSSRRAGTAMSFLQIVHQTMRGAISKSATLTPPTGSATGRLA
jgi:hypothetical protein